MTSRADLKTTKNSTTYKQALTATREIQPEAAGFIVPSEVLNNSEALGVLIKQNNTLLYILVNIDQKLGDLDERVSLLERSIGKLKVGQEFSETVHDLSKRLEGIKIAEKETQGFKRNFRVYKDPQKIFEERWNPRK